MQTHVASPVSVFGFLIADLPRKTVTTASVSVASSRILDVMGRILCTIVGNGEFFYIFHSVSSPPLPSEDSFPLPSSPYLSVLESYLAANRRKPYLILDLNDSSGPLPRSAITSVLSRSTHGERYLISEKNGTVWKVPVVTPFQLDSFSVGQKHVDYFGGVDVIVTSCLFLRGEKIFETTITAGEGNTIAYIKKVTLTRYVIEKDCNEGDAAALLALLPTLKDSKDVINPSLPIGTFLRFSRPSHQICMIEIHFRSDLNQNSKMKVFLSASLLHRLLPNFLLFW
jgi:hypothetical protein